MRSVRFLLSVFVLVGLAAGSAFAAGATKSVRKPVMDKALERPGKATDKLRVIVRYKAGAGAKVRARMQGKVDRIKGHNGRSRSLAVEMRRSKLAELCVPDPTVGIEGCSEDAKIKTSAVDPAPAEEPVYDGQHLRETLGIQPWDSAYSVGVAIIDSGIAPNDDLWGSIQAFYDFTAGGVETAPYDGYGHGTHIAGLITGSGYLSDGKYVGVAYGARLIGLKVLDAQGGGYTSDVIAAIEFATANKAALGIDIINLSLGHPIFESPATDPLVQAVESAVAAGIVVVASAGNHGYNPATQEVGYAGVTSPGNAPSALTVGSLRTKATADRSDDEVSLFSSRGPTWYTGQVKPDVVAPGQALIAINDTTTTLYQNPLVHTDIAPYIKLSGTSMAAGVATGVVALMIEANRQDEGYDSVLTPNMVKALLQFTALGVDTSTTDPGIPTAIAQGAGGINAAGAMALALAIDPAVAVGNSWIESYFTPFTDIAGATHSWGQQIVWGGQIVWGDTILKNRLAWAQQIVWGDDDQIVWGDDDQIVWGDDDQIVWGDRDQIVWGDSVLNFGSNLVRRSFAVWSNQIVWGDDDQIVWGDDDQIVWGDNDDQIVWGDDDDQIVWGDSFGFLEN